MTKGLDWTPEMTGALQQYMKQKENLSFNTIAELMTKQFGVTFTRNSTVGKAHRMKIPPRPLREKRTRENTRPRDLKMITLQSRPFIASADRSKVNGHDCDLVDLEHGACKWPDGASIPYSFCGRPIWEDGASYCAAHAEIAYVKPKKEWR